MVRVGRFVNLQSGSFHVCQLVSGTHVIQNEKACSESYLRALNFAHAFHYIHCDYFSQIARESQ